MDTKEIVISSLRESLFAESLIKFLKKTGTKSIIFITYGPSGEERAAKKVEEIPGMVKKRKPYEDVEIAETKNAWGFHFSHDNSFRVRGSQKFVAEFKGFLEVQAKVRFDTHVPGEKKPKLLLLDLRNEEEELYFQAGRGLLLMELIRKLAEQLGMDTSKLHGCRFYNLPYDSESYDRINSPFNSMRVLLTKETAHIIIFNRGGKADWGLRKKIIETVYGFCEKK